MAKIIFFGSGTIAKRSLEALINSEHQVVCVVTSPDRKKGRHLLNSQTPIKQIALNYGLCVFQPEELDSAKTIEYLKKFNCDFFIVFAYGKILPKGLLEIPSVLPLNIHASLLPKYRGAAPIQWSLFNGEKKTGVTYIKMNEKMDQGEIVIAKEIDILEDDNALTLEDKLSKLSADNLLAVIRDILSKKIDFKKQDDSKASYAPKLRKENGRIDWHNSAQQIYNQIRACFGWPGAFTFYQKKILKIWKAKIFILQSPEKQFGKILSVDKNGILVSTPQDALLIKELQFESGKRLSIEEFIKGHTLRIGEILT